MADDDVHRIKLRAKSLEELRAYLDGGEFDLGCRPVVRREGDEYVTEVYAPMPTLDRHRALRGVATVQATVVENATEVGRARQTEVGAGNRFRTRQIVRGLGIK